MGCWQKAPVQKLCGAGGGDNYGHSEGAHKGYAVVRSSKPTCTSSTFVCFSFSVHAAVLYDTFMTHSSWVPASTPIAPKSWLWETVFQALFSNFTALPAVNVAKLGLLLLSRNYKQVTNKFFRWVRGQTWYHIAHVSSHHSAYFSLACKIFKGLFLFKQVEHCNIVCVHGPVSTPACQYSNYYQTV